jgi:Ca-activated chloride channel homolog
MGVLPAVGALLWGAVGVARQDPTFTSRAELVVLYVNVRDRSGGFVTGLPAKAFAVLEDLRPQHLSLFVNEDTPVTTGLLIDNSISMRANHELVIAAAVEFAQSSHERDEIFALAFNEDVRPVLGAEAPFTNRPDVLKAALTTAISARGRTAFFDAVVSGLAYATRGTHPRRVLIVIGDGGDNASTATFADTIRQAQASNTTIYTVTLADPLDPDANPGRMAQLATLSGGETFKPRSRHEVASVLQRIARDIRHTYTLGYSPTKALDNTFRRLRVIVTPPEGQRLVVRTRGGYLAARPVNPVEAEADVQP